MSTGTIVAVIVVIVLSLLLPVVGFFAWKYRRVAQGVRVRDGRKLSIWTLPVSAKEITPYQLNGSLGDEETVIDIGGHDRASLIRATTSEFH